MTDLRTHFDSLLTASSYGGWKNSITGYGSLTDKTAAMSFDRRPALDTEVLSALYHGHDMSARVIEAQAEEEFRAEYQVKVDGDVDGKFGQQIQEKLQELALDSAFLDGRIWGRLFGGGATVLGADDGGGAADPLDTSRVKRFDWVRTIDRRYLWPNRRYLIGPKAGLPETYYIVPETAYTGYQTSGSDWTQNADTREIHESRMVLWPGVRTGRRERENNGSWDYSVLDRVWPTLQLFETFWKGVSVLLTDGSQGVYQVAGLWEKIMDGQGDRLSERFGLLDLYKSVLKSIIIDKDQESYERHNASFAGLPDLLHESELRLSGAVQTPVLILFGQQVGGLGQTSDGDLRWFFDRTKVSRKKIVEPRILQVAQIAAILLGRPDAKISLDWGNLWTMTDLEEAQVHAQWAAADAAAIQSEVLLPEEVALSRYQNKVWTSGYSGVDLAARKSALSKELTLLSKGPQPVDEAEIDAEIQSNTDRVRDNGEERGPDNHQGREIGG